jgi:hypothetical protein
MGLMASQSATEVALNQDYDEYEHMTDHMLALGDRLEEILERQEGSLSPMHNATVRTTVTLLDNHTIKLHDIADKVDIERRELTPAIAQANFRFRLYINKNEYYILTGLASFLIDQLYDPVFHQ